MKSIALIIPYFGDLPKYFRIFLLTAKYNKTIDFLIFTNQVIDTNADNIHVFNMSFEAFSSMVQEKFQFKIWLRNPYKICDFRPAFGYIFEKFLINYDFWGHCDTDVILGDIRLFVTENIMNQYDKIYQHGHLSLYKNTSENNLMFMKKGGQEYQDVFTSPVACIFDEAEGIQFKYDLYKKNTYKRKDFADISPWHDQFRCALSYANGDELKDLNYKEQVFFYNDGKVFRAAKINHEINYREYVYLHFQKRNPKCCFPDDVIPTSFYISKKGFIKKSAGMEVVDKDIVTLNGFSLGEEIKSRARYYHFIWKRRFNKYILKR